MTPVVLSIGKGLRSHILVVGKDGRPLTPEEAAAVQRVAEDHGAEATEAPSSAVGSPARTSAPPTPTARASTVDGPGCGGSSPESSTKPSPSESSSRTVTDSFGGAWTRLSPSSPTEVSRWKQPGCTPPTSAHPTDEPASLSSHGTPTDWPTPTASSYGSNQGGASGRTGKVRHSLGTLARQWATPTVKGNHNKAGLSAKSGDGLATQVSSEWPTPLASDGHRGSAGAAYDRPGRRPLRERVPGPLNPRWVAVLMGFPEGWTDPGPPGRDPTSIRGSHLGPSHPAPSEDEGSA